jgi:H+/Cl- antiporter ClcA
MLRKIGRLFTIKTRFEAYAVTYAIALGAVERGVHYLQQYPNWLGMTLALCCTGVVFVAGAKLLDSVRPQAAVAGVPSAQASARSNLIRRRNRPTVQQRRRASESPISLRRD